MEAQHMTQQTFASFIGMSAASLSSIFNNRTKPTLNTVEAIKSKIPNLSTDWLMFGSGAMYEDDKPAASPSADTATGSDNEPTLDFGGGTTNDLFGMPQDAGVSSAATAGRQPQAVKPEIRFVDRPQRRITEIHVYFDDNSFETFVPLTKPGK